MPARWPTPRHIGAAGEACRLPKQHLSEASVGCRPQSLASVASELRRNDKKNSRSWYNSPGRRGKLPSRTPAHRPRRRTCHSRSRCLCADGSTIHRAVEHRSGSWRRDILFRLPTQLSGRVRSSSDGSRSRPFAISGRRGNAVLACSPPARSTCARSTAGDPSPQILR